MLEKTKDSSEIAEIPGLPTVSVQEEKDRMMAEATSAVGRGRRKGACRRDSSQNPTLEGGETPFPTWSGLPPGTYRPRLCA